MSGWQDPPEFIFMRICFQFSIIVCPIKELLKVSTATYPDDWRGLVANGGDLQVSLRGEGSGHRKGGTHKEPLVLQTNALDINW